MAIVEFGSFAAELASADSALESEDWQEATAICREVIDGSVRIPASEPFEPLLLKAVATQRMALAQYQLGNHDEATASFSRVDDLLDESMRVVTLDEVADVVRATRTLSHEQRFALESGQQTYGIVCYAVCEHGCRCAITPCGYTSQHC